MDNKEIYDMFNEIKTNSAILETKVDGLSVRIDKAESNLNDRIDKVESNLDNLKDNHLKHIERDLYILMGSISIIGILVVNITIKVFCG
ncbi:MAG: hypothetical protein LBT10_03040 [Methanobrevibacter sp.]|nr:hypothetical protein [Methanobrevibacter sp.]